MKQYLLPENSRSYKACLHIHSNLSDGKLSPEEIKKHFMANGYSVVAYTDHEVIIPHNDLTDENFLAITSYELAVNNRGSIWTNTKTTHMNFYAKDKDNTVPPCFDQSKIWLEQTRPYLTEEMKLKKYDFKYSAECLNDVIAQANKAGFLVSYNHPVWSLQSREDYIDYKGLWAVECYNHECAVAGYEDTIVPVVDLLRKGERVFPIATDDSHSINSCCGGFVMIKADKLEYTAIMTALEKGDFYASNGPQISELTLEDGVLHIECSEAVKITINTERRITAVAAASEVEPAITSKDLSISKWLKESEELPEELQKLAYIRVTVTDSNGKQAWSKPYFYDEIIKSKVPIRFCVPGRRDCINIKINE